MDGFPELEILPVVQAGLVRSAPRSAALESRGPDSRVPRLAWSGVWTDETLKPSSG